MVAVSVYSETARGKRGKTIEICSAPLAPAYNSPFILSLSLSMDVSKSPLSSLISISVFFAPFEKNGGDRSEEVAPLLD